MAPGSVLDGPGAVLGVINIVTEGVDTFRRDELTLGGGNFKSFLYNYRYGTTFHEVSVAGFLQYPYTGGPELDVPVDGQTIRDRALAPLGVAPASLAPGQTDDDRKALDANLALAYRQLQLRGASEEGERGRLLRPARLARTPEPPRQHRRASSTSSTSATSRSATCAAASTSRRAVSPQLFDVYPPGFTIPARHEPPLLPQRRDLPGGPQLAAAGRGRGPRAAAWDRSTR